MTRGRVSQIIYHDIEARSDGRTLLQVVAAKISSRSVLRPSPEADIELAYSTCYASVTLHK